MNKREERKQAACGTQNQVSGCFLQDLHPTYKEIETLGVQGLRSGGGLLRVHSLSAAGPFLGPDFICFKLPTNGRESCQDQTADFIQSAHMWCWPLLNSQLVSRASCHLQEKVFQAQSQSSNDGVASGSLHLLQVLFCLQIIVPYSLRDHLSHPPLNTLKNLHSS